MCVYNEILGQGTTLVYQLITFVAIILSIASWVWIYRKQKVDLMRYAFPIMLWVVFGSLDIIITVKGTLGNPMNEGNPAARSVFMLAGDYGPVMASILWISLWSLIVLVMNKRIRYEKLAAFLSLVVFYSLVVGHILGFSSWFAPLCGISRASWILLSGWLVRLPGIIAIGCVLAAVHMLAVLALEKR